MLSTSRLSWVLASFSCLLAPLVLEAAPPKTAPRKPAPPRAALPAEQGADTISLKSGGKYVGALLDRTPEGDYRLAVRREWLKTAQPKLFAQESATELERLRECYRVLETRIADWKRDRPDDARLLGFLDDEADRAAKIRQQLEQPNPPLPEFMLIEILAARVERVQLAPADRKQVLLLAWLERLANPETRAVADLKRELESKKVPLDQQVDLFDRLAPALQSDAEWSQRQALAEYLYRKPLDFQGMGDALFATSGGAKAPKSEELIVAVLNQQLNSQLADLLGTPGAKPAEGDWTAKPARTAEAEGVNGFHVTRLKLDALNKRGEVEGRFLARTPEGRWETVWRSTQAADTTKARPDVEKRITNDPQVKQALGLLQVAGIDAQGNEFQSAIRLGAGVMEAQQATDAQFLAFRDRFTEHLDGPPLPRLPSR